MKAIFSSETVTAPGHSYIGLALALVVVALAASVPAAELQAVLTIKSDGSCVVRAETAQPRLIAEQQARAWERYQRNATAEEDDTPPEKAEPGKDAGPLSDDALARKLREQLEGQGRLTSYGGEGRIESIEVKSNTVRTVTTQAYASLEEFLRSPWALWSQSGISFENLRFEKDTNSNLRVTLMPHSGNPRWARNARQSWKATGTRAELRFVFPGRVLTSGLPNTASNATWIAFDASKEETLEAALKLYEAPTVITAEPGGLRLDAPLESKALQRRPGRGGTSDPDLPVTDAGPGFVAEANHVTITTVHYFPDGEKHLKETQRVLGHTATGVVVQAKLFAPKDRTLQSASAVRILKAVDDQGRTLIDEKSPDQASESAVYSSGGRNPGNSVPIQLRLPVPAADVQSIEQLDAEVIAATVGNWREMTVPNVSSTTTNEVDLTPVLPGAKMVLRKVTPRQSRTTIEGEIRGPATIRQIEVTASAGGTERRSSAYASDRGFTTKDNVSTRKFQLDLYASSEDGGISDARPSIVLRFPEDQKRERVKFTLKGLDLF